MNVLIVQIQVTMGGREKINMKKLEVQFSPKKEVMRIPSS
jgi:hypothetical protein